ncbi:discoidin domain-containing protein [candidate division KSB1 bacterium]|nr:discoidin domain-containing protein [candidate division KSB1 bacterium]
MIAIKTLLVIFMGLLSLNLWAQTDSTVVQVFTENMVHFNTTNPNQYDTPEVKSEDNGRIISRTLELPTFAVPVRIVARAQIIPVAKGGGVADPWDRGGTIYLAGEVAAEIEVLKFITGFGGLVAFEEDVTFLAPLLQGRRTIKGIIDTWVSPGMKLDFQLIYYPDARLSNPNWVQGLYYNFWIKTENITATEPSAQVNIPTGASQLILNYFTSGHCTDGSGAEEFQTRDHVIYIDDVEVHRYRPWRDDCRNFRQYNPYSGKWGDTWSSDLSRSGWCPGDIVHPLRLDLSKYLPPGLHTIRFEIKGIRPTDGSGNFGYWRVSAFLAVWQSGNPLKAHQIQWFGPTQQFTPTGAKLPLRINLCDVFGNPVPGVSGQVEIRASDPGVTFSKNQLDWANPLNLEMTTASALVWFRAENAGPVTLHLRDLAVTAPLPDPEPIHLQIAENLARQAKATADGICNNNETADKAIDGDLGTKWCCNNSLPQWLQLSFPDSITVNHFTVRHAGAGLPPSGDPGAGDNPTMNTKKFQIQMRARNGNSWTDLAAITDNPGTLDGNVTEHHLGAPAKTKEFRLYITNAGIDIAARIYEFELFNPEGAVAVEPPARNYTDTPTCLTSFYLFPNYPNPFNGRTQIQFFVPRQARISAIVVNNRGQTVAEILTAQLSRGLHTISWDGCDQSGHAVSSGVYFVSLAALDQFGQYLHQVQKIVLVQ